MYFILFLQVKELLWGHFKDKKQKKVEYYLGLIQNKSQSDTALYGAPAWPTCIGRVGKQATEK